MLSPQAVRYILPLMTATGILLILAANIFNRPELVVIKDFDDLESQKSQNSGKFLKQQAFLVRKCPTLSETLYFYYIFVLVGYSPTSKSGDVLIQMLYMLKPSHSHEKVNEKYLFLR